MNEHVGAQRIVLCGSPGAGKKRLLRALAECWSTPSDTVNLSTSGDGPVRVSWQGRTREGKTFRVETLHGPGFYYEDAVAELFASPISVVLYVLAQEHPGGLFDKSWRDMERSNLLVYLTAAEAQKRGRNAVPWLLIEHIHFPREEASAKWALEAIPEDLARLAMVVDSNSPRGLEELCAALESMLRSPA